jgi:hypothetical protein
MFETILRAPDAARIDGRPAEAEGGRFALGDVRVETSRTAAGLEIAVTAEKTPVSRITLRWHFAEKLKGQVLGDAWERAYGDLEWKNVSPWQTLPWYALVNRGNATAGYGVLVRPGAVCGWQIDPEGITLKLDVRCGGEGVLLGGRTLKAATVVSETYEGMSAFAAAKAFCRRMCPDPILPERPVYGANNWYYAYGRSSREDILADADYLARLTEGAENRPYLVIDDGWQRGRYDEQGRYEEIYNGGPWEPNDRFGDMRALAEEIRVLAYDGDIKPIVTLPLSAVPDCYNLMLHRSPLCLTRQTGDAFQIVWPEQVSFPIAAQETFCFRAGERLYFSKWFEDPDYREELVVRDLTGAVLAQRPGTAQTMPDGQLWTLE